MKIKFICDEVIRRSCKWSSVKMVKPKMGKDEFADSELRLETIPISELEKFEPGAVYEIEIRKVKP